MKLKYWKILSDYLLGWLIASLIWELLRNTDQITVENVQSSFSQRGIIFLISWIAQGIFYGFLHLFISRYITGRVPFVRLLFSVIILQLVVAIIFFITIFFILKQLNIFEQFISFEEFIQKPVLLTALAYALITNFFISLTIHINKILGKGNLMKIITGKFYKPKVAKRIFMFLDLRGSTTIAEKLGHLKYSRFIQDCFYDLAIVEDYKAEIYQYVGDEAILIWPVSDGKQSLNCINAFFSFQEQLRKRSKYYINEYGVVPEFKAGINIGEITIAEVGDFKREIAFHGDTINTAARVQAECNRLKADLLISEKLLKQLELESWIHVELKDEVQLRGKSGSTNIYEVEKAPH